MFLTQRISAMMDKFEKQIVLMLAVGLLSGMSCAGEAADGGEQASKGQGGTPVKPSAVATSSERDKTAPKKSASTVNSSTDKKTSAGTASSAAKNDAAKPAGNSSAK